MKIYLVVRVYSGVIGEEVFSHLNEADAWRTVDAIRDSAGWEPDLDDVAVFQVEAYGNTVKTERLYRE